MENDPVQAPSAAGFGIANFVKFLVTRAREAGAVDERERVTARTTVSKKIIESNATKAAAAKLAAQRGKTPPKAGKSVPSESQSSEVSDDAYQRAKAAGNFAEADRIVNAMAHGRKR